MRKIIPTLILSLALFFPMRVEEKKLPNLKNNHFLFQNISYHSLEGLIALSSIQGNEKNFSFLDSLKNAEGLSEKINSLMSKEKGDLKEMVKYHSGKFIRWEKFVGGLYQKYVQINNSIFSAKENFHAFKLFFSRDSFYLKGKDNIYLSKDNGQSIFENMKKLREIQKVTENPDTLDTKKFLYASFSRLFEYFPIIKNNSKDKTDFISNLCLIGNESNGFPYITGHSGDLNLMQINPSTIPGLYRHMRKSSGNSEIERIAKSMNLNSFEEGMKSDPKISLLSGIYLFDYLKRSAKTESQAVLYYLLGEGAYYSVSKKFRERIEKGMVNSWRSISDKESKIKEMNYLQRYYIKKEIYSKLVDEILN